MREKFTVQCLPNRPEFLPHGTTTHNRAGKAHAAIESKPPLYWDKACDNSKGLQILI